MPDTETTDTLDAAVAAVRARTDARPDLVLILGSGLGALADEAEDAVVIPTSEVPGYPRSTVQGHAGRLVFGQFEGRSVLFVQGRVHLYEGHAASVLGFPVRLAHALGARRMLVTNAAGGIDPTMGPGTLMFIADHLNLAFASPMSGPVRPGEPRWPDMAAPYDPAWLDRAERLALDRGIPTRRGVYLWTTGPSYETPAEIRFFRRIGADAVGMSTVPEVIQATALGMPVLGISAITNAAAGLNAEPLNHEEVMEAGRQVQQRFAALVRAIVADDS
ncbi:MAG: purine-nucleoside phosphorylase [Rhodothermales bacterium]